MNAGRFTTTHSASAWFRVEKDGWGENVDLSRNSVHRINETLHHPLQDYNILIATLGLAEDKRRRHVVNVGAAGDHRRPPIDQQVEAEARPLVFAVAFNEHVACQRMTELVHSLSHRS